MQLIELATFFLYLFATLLKVGHWLNTSRPIVRWWWVFALLAAVVHGYLLYYWIDVGNAGVLYTQPGQNLAYANIISLVCWLSIVLILAGVSRKSVANLLIFVMPCAALSILQVQLFPQQQFFDTGANPGQLIHIFSALIAFSVLCIAGVQAIVLAWQDYLLRGKRANYLIRALPPVESMENLLFEIIVVGFFCLSFVLVSSIFFFNHLLFQVQTHSSKLMVVAWFVFATLIVGRYYFAWRGRTAIRWTLAGMLILLLAYFGSYLF